MLQLSAVSLQLAGRSILTDINFALQQGEFIGIIGPNGAGKSSLLKIISGALLPASGTISFKQKSLKHCSDSERARLIAVVSQSPAPVFSLTVEQVATMGLLPHKKWYESISKSDKDRVRQALTTVGLLSKCADNVDALSGGELQRLYIALALVQQPQLLLLDEPTNHLDVKYQHQVLSLVKQQRLPVLACLHDLNLAATYCDKLLLLSEGRQLAFGTVEQVLQQAVLEQVFGLPCEVIPSDGHNSMQIRFFAPAKRELQ